MGLGIVIFPLSQNGGKSFHPPPNPGGIKGWKVALGGRD
jgi:hypothetical protein